MDSEVAVSTREVWVAEMSEDGRTGWTADEGNADKGLMEDYVTEQNKLREQSGAGMAYRLRRYVPAREQSGEVVLPDGTVAGPGRGGGGGLYIECAPVIKSGKKPL